MKSQDVGFWMLLIGVAMVLYMRIYVMKSAVFKNNPTWYKDIFKLDWLTQWQNVSALLVTFGTILLWKKIQ